MLRWQREEETAKEKAAEDRAREAEVLARQQLDGYRDTCQKLGVVYRKTGYLTLSQWKWVFCSDGLSYTYVPNVGHPSSLVKRLSRTIIEEVLKFMSRVPDTTGLSGEFWYFKDAVIEEVTGQRHFLTISFNAGRVAAAVTR